MSGRFWGGVSAAVAAVVLIPGGAVQAQDVYTSVVPCRLADTRAAGGTLAAGTVRDFKVTGSGLQGQGGNPLGCEVPAGVATAAVINFVAVNPSGTGNLRAWAYSEPGVAPPNASIINFTTGVNIANGIVVPLCDSAATTCTFDIKVQADGNGAHLVADVVGYFRPPTSTQVDWADVANKPAGFADNVDNDSGGDITAVTPAPGSGLTGGGTAGPVTIGVDNTLIQSRVNSTCSPGNAIRAIAQNGTVTCEPDDVGSGDITSVNTAQGTSGLDGGAPSGDVNLIVDPTDFNGAAPIIETHDVSEDTVAIGVTSTLITVSVVVPSGAASGGHIALVGAANVRCRGSNCPSPLPATTGVMGWDNVSDGPGQNQKVWNEGPNNGHTVVAIDQFLVTAPGTYTFYLRGNCIGPTECGYANISGIGFFIPR
jgi:hypothetical protein